MPVARWTVGTHSQISTQMARSIWRGDVARAGESSHGLHGYYYYFFAPTHPGLRAERRALAPT